jgi:hypothetical protein
MGDYWLQQPEQCDQRLADLLLRAYVDLQVQ